jgi:proline-specific peptidase
VGAYGSSLALSKKTLNICCTHNSWGEPDLTYESPVLLAKMNATSISSQEGYADFKHPSLPADKECQTWYKVIGDLSSDRRPLVALHGGPGGSHLSLADAFKPYATKTGTPVVLYDQLGNGNSTHLREKRGDVAFWVPELFVAELDNLVRHLGVRNSFDLYGHSWGAKLAAKYAASPLSEGSGLNRVIIGSGSCNQKDLQKAGELLRRELPQDVQDTINKYQAENNFNAPEYRAALTVFLKKHLCRLDPWPASMLQMMKVLQEDDTVYFTMYGQDPLNPVGNLRGI